MNKRKIVSSIRDWNIKGSGKLSYFIAKFILPKPLGKTVIDTIYNFQLNVDPIVDNGVERALYYYGTYEKGTLDIIGKILKKGDVFVDVGANIGLMSIYAALIVGREGNVFAFEPNPNTKDLLIENMSLNKIKNIKVEGLALSSETKKSKIYDRWDVNRGGASLIKPSNPTQSYDIQETTFSEYFNSNQDIKLIKIDVEGFELEVLKGAKAFILNTKTPPILIVEFSSMRVNTFGKNTEPLYDFLKDLSHYRIFQSVRGKERISKLIEIKDKKNLPKHDNIYCFTNEHLNELPNVLFKTMPSNK